MTTVKKSVKALYFVRRTIFLPLITIDRLIGFRPYVTVASVPVTVTAIVWNLVLARHRVVATLAILLPGLLLSYLFGVWGKEFEREREIKQETGRK